MKKADVVREVREKNKSEGRAYKARQWREFKCFFTWPFLHHYESMNCVYCDHAKQLF